MSDVLEALAARERRRASGGSPPIVTIVIASAVLLIWVIAGLGGLARAMGQASAETAPGAALGWVIGNIIGASFFPTLIVWAVAWFASIRRSRPSWGATIFFCMGGAALLINVLVALGLTATLGADAKFSAASTEIERAIAETKAAGDDAPVDLGPIRTTGAAGEFEAVVKARMTDLIKETRQYKATMAALDIRGAMQPASLARADLGDIDAKIAKAREASERYRVAAERSMADIRKSIEKAPMSDASRKDMLQGFDEGYGGGASLTLVGRMLDELSGEVAVLRRAKGRWVAENGQIYFNRDSDMAAFNGHATALQELQQELEAIQTRTGSADVAPAR